MHERGNTRSTLRGRSMLLIGCALLAGCASTMPAPAPLDTLGEVPELRPGLLAGYLPQDALPDSLALLPPPPAPDSAALALDESISASALALRGSPRWALAAEDAQLAFPDAAGTFSCALGAPISEADTPNLYRLLRRTLVDAGLATYGAKTHYARPGPSSSTARPPARRRGSGAAAERLLSIRPTPPPAGPGR